MNSLHSLRTECRSEWQMPQKRISIWTSRSVGSRRLILVEASPDVALPAEYAFALKVDLCMSLIPRIDVVVKRQAARNFFQFFSFSAFRSEEHTSELQSLT